MSCFPPFHSPELKSFGFLGKSMGNGSLKYLENVTDIARKDVSTVHITEINLSNFTSCQILFCFKWACMLLHQKNKFAIKQRIHEYICETTELLNTLFSSMRCLMTEKHSTPLLNEAVVKQILTTVFVVEAPEVSSRGVPALIQAPESPQA